ncbi:Amino-acid acetyltransferase, mitochondrial [Mortierella sp. GBA30]|nr:Amino-acid acetyltransferase, mitochondrial [Mortierella sp. GBA30]
MWCSLLTRPAGSPRVSAFTLQTVACRSYSLKSSKIQAIMQEHRQAREKDRDLIIKVMGTMPSPREARQFLSKFSPVVPTTISSKSCGMPSTTATTTDTDFVDTLLWPTDHLALIKLEGPFEKVNLTAIANTLVQLQQLGLMSIVMLDNQTWWQTQTTVNPLHTIEDQDSAETRERMMKDMFELVEEIEKSGGRARPVYEDVFEAKTSLRQGPGHDRIPYLTATAERDITVRPGLRPIQSSLKMRHIPVMIPMATTSSSHRIPVQSNRGLVALAKYMGSTTKTDLAHGAATHGPLVPMRLIVVNTTGGIPLTRTSGIKGPTHCFVNLKDEYLSIIDDLDNMDIPHALAKSYRSDLDMIQQSLEYLPRTCSALITSSPSLTLITNLITDKPLFSSTMRGQDPKGMLATTVLRSGLDIFTFRNSLQGLDLKKLQGLLESSFGKPLDGEGFYSRIQDRTKTVILAGLDYMGAAIVTREGGDEDPEAKGNRRLATVAYLDKFSIAPKSQGIGVADILWKKLTDEFPDLVWRSRSDNPVNKWYFDRADGNIKIPGTNWTVFWYGPQGLGLMRDYMKICRDIPASFLAAKPHSKS